MAYRIMFGFCLFFSLAFFGIAWANNGNPEPMFIDKSLAISLGSLTLLITAAITIGKRTAVFDSHLKDTNIHVELSDLQMMFVDKQDCREKTRLLQETHDAVVEINSKVNRLIEKGKESK